MSAIAAILTATSSVDHHPNGGCTFGLISEIETSMMHTVAYG